MPPGRSTCADAEIRIALHRKKLQRWKGRDDVLVVDELGLAHAKCRIDVAVINGCVHGYEIKSAQDTLARLPAQIGVYRETLERLTVVCASKHLEGVVRLVPEWCGVIESVEGAKGGIRFSTVRLTGKNPEVDSQMLAHLLWRSEAIALLSQYNLPPKDLRGPRTHLYRLIAERLTSAEIT